MCLHAVREIAFLLDEDENFSVFFSFFFYCLIYPLLTSREQTGHGIEREEEEEEEGRRNRESERGERTPSLCLIVLVKRMTATMRALAGILNLAERRRTTGTRSESQDSARLCRGIISQMFSSALI